MSSARRNIASPGCNTTKLRKNTTNKPMSPGNWLFSRGSTSSKTLLPGSGADSPAKLLPCSFTCASSCSLADLMSSSFEFMRWLKASLSSCLSSTSVLPVPSTAASKRPATPSPTKLRNDLTFFRKYSTSFSGLKPHMPSKGVIAIVISGLWLSSLYSFGFLECSCSASFLFGCAWIESAFWIERTLNRYGSF